MKVRRAVSTDQRVAQALWFLATGADYRTVSHLSVWCVLRSSKSCYLEIPTGSALRGGIDGFKNKHGFPQCVRAIDGTHIPIISPKECPADYNCNGYRSIILQGTVDHQACFVDVYVGWPGRVHDA